MRFDREAKPNQRQLLHCTSFGESEVAEIVVEDGCGEESGSGKGHHCGGSIFGVSVETMGAFLIKEHSTRAGAIACVWITAHTLEQ